MKIPTSETAEVLSRSRVIEQRLESHPLNSDPAVDAKLMLCARKRTLADDVKALKKEIRKSNGIIKLDELKARKRVSFY